MLPAAVFHFAYLLIVSNKIERHEQAAARRREDSVAHSRRGAPSSIRPDTTGKYFSGEVRDYLFSPAAY